MDRFNLFRKVLVGLILFLLPVRNCYDGWSNDASRAAGILDYHGTYAIALDPIQQRREARACLDRVGTGDGGVIELFDDRETGPLGEALDGVRWRFSLSLSAPTLAAELVRK